MTRAPTLNPSAQASTMSLSTDADDFVGAPRATSVVIWRGGIGGSPLSSNDSHSVHGLKTTDSTTETCTTDAKETTAEMAVT